jgi:pyruvate dehydrogenase E2 component (dihydrolipoamide acetyltransferase)
MMAATGDAVESRAERTRRAIAAAVSESWATIPHFAVSREIEGDGIVAALPRLREATPAVSLTDLLLAATAYACEVDVVGLAVATDSGVINVSIGGIGAEPGAFAEQRREAVERARRGALKAIDLAPTTVTLSNLGTHGVAWFTGIVPLNNVLLLTVGALRRTDGDGAGRFWITANADHRSVDGAHAARVLERFDEWCTRGGATE